MKMATATLRTSTPATKTIHADTLGTRFMDWLVRVGEQSSGARAARAYAALNALSDAELAARGLNRGDLFDRCFGPVHRG